jgi:hypothetical protein
MTGQTEIDFTTPVAGSWVRYHGSITACVGQIMRVKRATSTHLTLETATGGTLRNVRYESVTLDTP